MLRSRSRIVALFTLFMTCAVLLSGCFHVDSDVKLNGDGSGSYTLTLGLSEAVVGLAGDEFVNTMNQSGQKLKQEGGEYRHFDQDGYSVWVFTRPFKDVSELNALLKQFPTSSSTNPGDSTSIPSSTQPLLAVSESPGFFVNSFHATGHISLKDLNSSSSDAGGIDISSYMQNARESIAITMPGWINSYSSGGVVNGNTVTYTAHYNEEATIDVVGGGVNPPVYYIAAGTGLLVLLVIGLVIFWRRRTRRTRAPESAIAPIGVTSGADIYSFSDTPGLPLRPQSSPSGEGQEDIFDRDYGSQEY